MSDIECRWIDIALKRPWHIGGELIPIGIWWNPRENLGERKLKILSALINRHPRTLKASDLSTLRWNGVPDGAAHNGVLALVKKGKRGRIVAITACPSLDSPHFEDARKELGVTGEVPLGLELVYERI